MVRFQLRRIFKKDEKTTAKATFEDSLKAKAKLNLLEKRYEMIKSLVTGKDEKNDLGASVALKAQLIATQGFGEVGDNARPSNEAVEGFQELLEYAMLDELEYGKEDEITKTDTVAIFGALANLLNRSVRREHTNVEIVTMPPEMFMPNWLTRAGRESSLET